MKSVIVGAVATAVSAVVETTMYSESLCPYCRVFTVDQLGPAHRNLGDDIEVNVIPYGNAKIVNDEIVCQHGKPECDGNKVMACGIRVQGGWPLTSAAMEFLECYEDMGQGKRLKWEGCVDDEQVKKEIQTCLDTKEAEELHREMGRRTGPHKFVPWCIVNGKEVGCTDEFELEVCRAIKQEKGAFPAYCLEVRPELEDEVDAVEKM